MSFLVIALFTLTAHADVKLESPDGALLANVLQLRNSEIYVTIGTKEGKTVADLNLLSQDAEHGRVLGKAVWSKDSRFLVLTTESSGGHSPWHDQAYFFSRASETFRSVDERSGDSVAAIDFAIGTNDVLQFRKYDFDRGIAVPSEVSLPALDRSGN
jgi:hypothetical protein